MNLSVRPASEMQPRMRGVPLPPLDGEQFGDWQGLLLAHTGIVMPAARQEFLGDCLHELRAGHGFEHLEQLRMRLSTRDAEAAALWGALVARLTLQQTYFFRHQPSLDWIAQHWLPAHLQRIGTQNLTAWNIGCGSGEETWTLAMLLDTALSAAGHRGGFALAGSEMGLQALARAQRGVYPQARLRELAGAEALRYCQMADEGGFSIDGRLRQHVSFLPLDLGDAAEPPFARLDLIYCQNVLIYFTPERRLQLLERFTGWLKPGGLLVLGPGEVPGEAHAGLLRTGARGVLAFLRQGAA